MITDQILVAIVTHNNAKDINACLRSLSSNRAALHVTILDNASSDGTLDCLPEDSGGKNLEVRRSAKNIGFAAAANVICRDVRGYNYVLLVNPDTELRPTTIDALLDLADRHPRAGLYGGRMIDGAGHLNPVSCLAGPSIRQALAFALIAHRFPGLRSLDPDSLGGWDRRGIREVPVLTAGMLLVRTSLWEALQGFDEGYFLYGEDVDFCLRARQAGARPMFTDQAVYTHRTGSSSRTPARQITAMLTGKMHLFRRTLQPVAAQTACILLMLGVGLRAIIELPAPVKTWREVWFARGQWSRGWAVQET